MVNFTSNNSKLNKKRGISTIIGGIIFLVLLSTGFSTFFLAMDVQSDTFDAQQKMSDLMIDKTKEDFTIAASTDLTNSNRLGIQLKNLGSNPVFVENVWIINNSGNFPAKKYLINFTDSTIPAGYGTDILESTPLFMKVDDYEIKVVSTLGTIKQVDLTVGASNNMRAELIAIPPHVKVGQNVTLTMHVENIGYTTLLNVVPFGDYPNIAPPFTTPNPPAPTPVDLDPGEGIFFIWEYETTGSAGSIVTFDSYATAQEEDTGFIFNSNVVVEKIELTEPDDSEIIVLTEDLIGRPGMFMIIPGPFGDASYRGLFGMNVVNPTDQTMKVNKVVISALIPRSTASDKFFGLGCSPQNLFPGTGGWECPIENQLAWHKGEGGPAVSIPPFSVAQFLTKVFPDDLPGSSIDIESVIIHANVFTTLGQFGKAGYGSSFDNNNAIVNVFLSEDYEKFGNTEIFSTVSGIPSGGPVTLYATLANFHPNTFYEIAEAEFIINVPKGWGAPVITRSDGFSSVVVIPSPDTSHQIVGTLDILNPITGNGGDVARTIQFDTVAPVVTNTQMYVMYVLADGETGNGYRIGPLAEIVLQVTP